MPVPPRGRSPAPPIRPRARPAGCALPSLFAACHEDPYAPSSPGFGQWPRTKFPWFGELGARGYAILSVHRGKNLLVSPEALDATSLQLEYLPSGDVCRGRVTAIGGSSFAGTCTLPNGSRRSVDASWVPADRGSGVVGEIRLHA